RRQQLGDPAGEAGAGQRRRRGDLRRHRDRHAAQGLRPGFQTGRARHPAQGRGGRRPEARHDAGGSLRARRRSPRHRPADHRQPRSRSQRPGHRARTGRRGIMAIFTKIRGINAPVAMQTAVENGADMIGLIFYPPSPRNVTAEQAEELLRDLPSGIDRVGVFVNPETDFLDRILAKARLDLMQLHGDETPDRCRALSIYFGLPVIKAFKVSEKADLKAARDYEDIVDWLMFDAKPPKDAKLPGGNAVS